MQKKKQQQSQSNLPPEQTDSSPETIFGQIRDISCAEYTRVAPKLDQLFIDIKRLYNGDWPEYEACQVGYHNINHCLAVALATARMFSGWNKVNAEHLLPESLFLSAMAAAFFHDAGYLKNKNDDEGTGGKYTFSHVGRSRELARNYLTKHGWAADDCAFVCRIIEGTEFGESPDFSIYNNDHHLVVAKMVASADLIAQMADINYIRRLHDLHDEFLEAYKYEGHDNLRRRSIHIYNSFQEMLDNTPQFYTNFVLPRLRLFDRMDKYLVAFFNDGRNPYFENITANISGQLLNNRVQWQKLGDILQEQGFVAPDTINEALNRLKAKTAKDKQDASQQLPSNFNKLLRDWLKSRSEAQTRLGDILMEMKAVDPQTLRTGLLSQLLPQELTHRLSREELLSLLQISLLAHNLYDDPWFFSQILEMTLILLQSKSCSLLLANKKKTELHIALHCGPEKDKHEGKAISTDKGLSGWVYRHSKTAFVTKTVTEDLFWEKSHLETEEIDSILAVPLHINGEIIGVVEVMNKKHGNFTDHDADILTLLTNIIACSLAMVKLQIIKSI